MSQSARCQLTTAFDAKKVKTEICRFKSKCHRPSVSTDSRLRVDVSAALRLDLGTYTHANTHTYTHTHTHTQRSGIRLLSRARQPIHAFSLFRSISCFFLPSCFLPLFPFLFALVARTNYTSVRPSPHFVVRLKYILHIPRCNRLPRIYRTSVGIPLSPKRRRPSSRKDQ